VQVAWLKGGSIRASGVTSTAWLNLRGKALPDQTVELLSILQDILGRARLDNRGRFQQLVLEEKASLESRLVPAGSSYVDRRLRASLFESDWADEQMGGVSYLFFLRKLADDIETNWEGVLAALERIRSTLVNRAAMLCNVTAETGHWARLKPQLALSRRATAHSRKSCTVARRGWPTFRRPRYANQGQLRWQGRRPLSRGN
jgi:presequence protease